MLWKKKCEESENMALFVIVKRDIMVSWKPGRKLPGFLIGKGKTVPMNSYCKCDIIIVDKEKRKLCKGIAEWLRPIFMLAPGLVGSSFPAGPFSCNKGRAGQN